MTLFMDVIGFESCSQPLGGILSEGGAFAQLAQGMAPFLVNSDIVLVYESVLIYQIAACRKVVTIVPLLLNTAQELRIPAIHPYDVECCFGA